MQSKYSTSYNYLKATQNHNDYNPRRKSEQFQKYKKGFVEVDSIEVKDNDESPIIKQSTKPTKSDPFHMDGSKKQKKKSSNA